MASFRHRNRNSNSYVLVAGLISFAYTATLFLYGYHHAFQHADRLVQMLGTLLFHYNMHNRQVICFIADCFDLPAAATFFFQGCLVLNVLTVVCYAVTGFAIKRQICEC